MTPWMVQVIELSASKRHDDALDVLYTNMLELQSQRELTLVDDILAWAANAPGLTSTVLVGLLCITLNAELIVKLGAMTATPADIMKPPTTSLKNRGLIADRIRREYPKSADKLLSGLI